MCNFCFGDANDPEEKHVCNWGFPGGAVVKNLPANAGDAGDAGSIPGLGRSPGGGNGNPLWYSCLENPMDRRDWWATVQGVRKILWRRAWQPTLVFLPGKSHRQKNLESYSP